MKNYTIKELAELLEVSERTILRQIQTISDKLKNPYSKGFTMNEDLKNIVFSDKFQTKKMKTNLIILKRSQLRNIWSSKSESTSTQFSKNTLKVLKQS